MSEIKKQKKKETFAPIGKVSNRWGWGFVSISVIMISVLVFIPMIQSFLLSLQSGQGNQLTFAGLSNYADGYHLPESIGQYLFIFIGSSASHDYSRLVHLRSAER